MSNISLADSLISKKKISVYTPRFYTILSIFILLLGTGLINLYSASGGSGIFFSQLYVSLLCLIVVTSMVRYLTIEVLYATTYLTFGIVCFLLFMVIAIGEISGGGQRWLSIGGLRGQPSELAKVVSVLIVAKFFKDLNLVGHLRIKEIWPLLAMIFGIFILIFVQPDFGTSGLCLLVCFFQFIFIPFKRQSLYLAGITAILSSIIGWFYVLLPYQKQRIINFLNPDLDPSGSGYNLLQSLVAIGSGYFWGKGYLDGSQTHLKFLPARQTDFIFSVFAEEHGFFAGCFLFAMFFILIYTSMLIAKSSKDIFSSLVVIGASSCLFIQFAINIAMVLGWFPVVGLPLPFMSHGGSSLIVSSILIGLILMVEKENGAEANRSIR